MLGQEIFIIIIIKVQTLCQAVHVYRNWWNKWEFKYAVYCSWIFMVHEREQICPFIWSIEHNKYSIWLFLLSNVSQG